MVIQRLCYCSFNPLGVGGSGGDSYHGLKPVATDVYPFGMDRGVSVCNKSGWEDRGRGCVIVSSPRTTCIRWACDG